MGETRRPSQGEVRQFKGSTVFDWDAEPVDERPSEFSRTTGYSGLSSYSTLEGRGAAVAMRQGGLAKFWIGVLAVVALSAGGIVGLSTLLRL